MPFNSGNQVPAAFDDVGSTIHQSHETRVTNDGDYPSVPRNKGYR
jgi:hypothetical protein